MRIFKPLIAVLFLLYFSQSASAQERKLSISLIGTFPSSIEFGDTAERLVVVRNDDTATFIGSIELAYTTSVDTFNGSSGSSGFSYFFIPSDTLAPGEQVSSFLILNASAPRFMVGPSVVVIWPISTDINAPVYALDSIKFNIDVTEPVGLQGIEKGGILCYYEGGIGLRGVHDLWLTHVRIYNATGALVHNVENPQNGYYEQLPPLPRGIYIADVMLNDKRRLKLKFISLH